MKFARASTKTLFKLRAVDVWFKIFAQQFVWINHTNLRQDDGFYQKI